jgi:hypothetical protein
VTGRPEAADSETVKLPWPGEAALPSAKLALDMLTEGGASSLRIVPVAVPCASVAPLGFESETVRVSFAS